jgi:hypothetical protein
LGAPQVAHARRVAAIEALSDVQPGCTHLLDAPAVIAPSFRQTHYSSPVAA